MQDIITNDYLVCHHRKDKVHKVTASDYEAAKRVMQDLHHMNASSLPSTHLYARVNGDWDLVHWLSYEVRNGKPKTVKHK